jgi:class 3 adenylate cyclase
MVQPESGYARTPDGVYLAYQTFGSGPIDVFYQPDWPGNIDLEWETPSARRFFSGLATFARVIMHDHRGIGLSSRNVPIPDLGTRVADSLTVMDAVESPRPILLGVLGTGSVSAMLAATRPDRVASLVWIDPSPRTTRASDWPFGRTPEELDAEIELMALWGTAEYGPAFHASEASYGNVLPEEDIAHFSWASRNACTPDVAVALEEMWAQTDVRSVLPTISVPTLLLSQAGTTFLEESQATAQLIPGAILHETGPGWTAASVDRVVDEIRRFAGVERLVSGLDTVLATVMFTDIVESTNAQARLGDAGWRQLLEQHNTVVREALDRWHGHEAGTAGDGFLATFESPARAVRCALEIVDGVRRLGIQVRAGVHTGECEQFDGQIQGISVSIGARIAAMAAPSQVLASQTVKDLVAGSRLAFDDGGEHELKGVPGRWRIYAVVADEG